MEKAFHIQVGYVTQPAFFCSEISHMTSRNCQRKFISLCAQEVKEIGLGKYAAVSLKFFSPLSSMTFLFVLFSFFDSETTD